MVAISINEGAKVYTAKYVDPDGIQKFVDITASGQGDAETQWRKKFPGCKLVNLWRKN